MRPKKVVLCIDTDEEDLSRTCFLLQTNGFRVLRACTAKEGRTLLEMTRVNLIVWFFHSARVSADRARPAGWSPLDLPILLVGELRSIRGIVGYRDRAVKASGGTPALLLELVREMTARKRGPRPKGRATQTLLVS